MTHELKKIIQAYRDALSSGKAAVLATVVALEGSSYRRPGVRMLLFEDGRSFGAVSGGCVEKEIWRQAETVFLSGIPKMMAYDGRYRLGCEGILHLLLEPFRPGEALLEETSRTLEARTPFFLKSYFRQEEGTHEDYGTIFQFPNKTLPLRPGYAASSGTECLEQAMMPCFKLLLIGSEHDAVQLCSLASLTGWEVSVLASVDEEKTARDFPGVHRFVNTTPDTFKTEGIDKQTAIVVMTHSFVKDLKYLLRLQESRPAYLGILGPAARREKLLAAFLEHAPEADVAFFDDIHGPAGLNIGAETPQEIAISILAEILSVIRVQQPMPLRDKSGRIHS